MKQPPSTSLPGAFVTTRWTQVLRARGESDAAKKALGELCETYWTPVHRFLLREGRDPESARDLTQEFFTRLLARHGLDTVEPERGRFRSFLLGAVKHFLADQRDHERAQRRGGGQTLESLESATGTSAALQVRAPDSPPPDTFFDRQWALAVMDCALRLLEAEFAAEGKAAQFAALKPWVAGETDGLSQAVAAESLGLSEGAVKVAIHRLRKRFRELVRAEIAHTLDDPAQVDDELRYLVEVLSSQG